MTVERRIDLLEQVQRRETSKDAPFEGPWLPSEESEAIPSPSTV
jgi:hypothetical protein